MDCRSAWFGCPPLQKSIVHERALYFNSTYIIGSSHIMYSFPSPNISTTIPPPSR